IAGTPSKDDQPNYVFRIGTYIRYFIPENLGRVYDDAQLDTFIRIDGGTIKKGKLVYREPKNDQRTLERLKELGFKYIIFDPNMTVIEKNEEGTLHQKARRFVEFANAKLKILYHDPGHRIDLLEVP
ncbi:MAG: hypothetical protein ACYTG7_21290, partial [Planctomycetota bacterium]